MYAGGGKGQRKVAENLGRVVKRVNVPEGTENTGRGFRAALARFWTEYQQIGVNDGLSSTESRCVRTLNGIVLIVTGLLWL